MSKILRLLLFSQCNRSCEGCCNNDWDLITLPQVQSFEGYSSIILTGGEPMLRPELIVDTVSKIREVNKECKIILYTAKSKRALDLVAMMNYVDGVTLTLHEQYDVSAFEELQKYMKHLTEKSLRLNVFSHVDLSGVDTSNWKVKDGIEWIKDCPLPDNEVFMRL